MDAPTIDAVGLNRPGDRQFSQDLWDGSDGRLIMTLLAELPVVTDNPPLRELTRRLLITGGAAPVGLIEPGQALAARLERLLAMGDLDDAQALAQQLPLQRTPPELARPATEIALLVGDDETACTRAGEAATRSTDAFWTKVTAYCQLVANDAPAAQLSLDLLRDEEHGDPPFYQLAGRIVDGGSDAAPAQL
ncbi:MAG: hypothetical protein OET79_07895, partial [Nitrospirota bacterium]|nr:hypothetical protein [Nitrospirota bacterium]